MTGKFRSRLGTPRECHLFCSRQAVSRRFFLAGAVSKSRSVRKFPATDWVRVGRDFLLLNAVPATKEERASDVLDAGGGTDPTGGVKRIAGRDAARFLHTSGLPLVHRVLPGGREDSRKIGYCDGPKLDQDDNILAN
jgi:hypothetical protein